MEFYATCPEGFESLLAQELRGLHVRRVRPLKGRVSFDDELEGAYRTLLWSRLASRVVLVIARGDAADADALYETSSGIDWGEHLPFGKSFAVNASGTNIRLKNTQFTALRVKDAITDTLLSSQGMRPKVNPKSPDVSVVANISGERVALGIDLAGAPLTRRGYESSRVRHSLRPDYASALLALAGWVELARDGEAVLVDASTDPTTIILEAASIACNRAPGLLRLRWGCTSWQGHDAALWRRLIDEASEVACEDTTCRFFVDPAQNRCLPILNTQLRGAGMACVPRNTGDATPPVTLVAADLSDFGPDDVSTYAHALTQLAGVCDRMRPAHVACTERDTLATRLLGRDETARIDTRMGSDRLHIVSIDTSGEALNQSCVDLPSGESLQVFVPASDQFVARLKKNARLRAKWARKEDVSCYRVYDADLPDYALTIDLFQQTDPKTGEVGKRKWLWVSEYAAPKEVDADLARARLMDALACAPRILDVDPDNVFLRVRRHDKGGSQYAHEGPGQRRAGARGRLPMGAHIISEGGLDFEVNFSTRLDCGIFLDHRDTRALIREMAKLTKGSKRFLNLFAYTGTATCYAADGGARHTTTVDLSAPTLSWARRNMERNGFTGPEHEFVQADVVSWIQEQRHTKNRWDLIFCDVPTFSNSSRMGKRSFDVQRDHTELLIGVSRLLTRDGTCVFSCNLRTFRPDMDKLARAGVTLEDITAKTIPEDFKRNPLVHHAYLVRRTSPAS